MSDHRIIRFNIALNLECSERKLVRIRTGKGLMPPYCEIQLLGNIRNTLELVAAVEDS